MSAIQIAKQPIPREIGAFSGDRNRIANFVDAEKELVGVGDAGATRASTSAVLRVLMKPWLDRTIAVVACVPFVYLTYYRYQHMSLGIPLICYSIGFLVLVLTMALRRPPKRVTPNPLYWLLRLCVLQQIASRR